MRDWLEIYSTMKTTLQQSGLEFGAAMPSWVDDYFGEEVQVTFNGTRQGVMKHMMAILDEYVVMSYNTNPSNAAFRLNGELLYADSLSVRPRIYAAMETHSGPGPTVSYGDHPEKGTKTIVLQDLGIIDSILSSHASFKGVCIHDWVGWTALPQ